MLTVTCAVSNYPLKTTRSIKAVLKKRTAKPCEKATLPGGPRR